MQVWQQGVCCALLSASLERSCLSPLSQGMGEACGWAWAPSRPELEASVLVFVKWQKKVHPTGLGDIQYVLVALTSGTLHSVSITATIPPDRYDSDQEDLYFALLGLIQLKTS